MPRLIVNADDYGLTAGVNRGIQDVFAAGGVTSATVMAGAVHAQEAANFARHDARLGVGCHVVLVDGAPLRNAKDVPSLLAPGTETFYATPARFLAALLAGKIRSEHLTAEIGEQLKRAKLLGIQPAHVDTHKHLHVFPAVLSALLTAAGEHGIAAVRNPFEPAWAVAASNGAATLRKVEVSALRKLYAGRFRRAASEQGFATTDGAIGVAATGSLDSAMLEHLLRAMPEGTWELVCHPGYADGELNKVKTRLRQSRDIEADALRQMPQLLSANTELINFSGLRA